MIVRILIGVLTMAATLATATAASAFDESRYPDWSGQWRWNPMGGGPRYDPSKRYGSRRTTEPTRTSLASQNDAGTAGTAHAPLRIVGAAE